MPKTPKLCSQCGETFLGRANQKFCNRVGDGKCKNDYNNARRDEPRRAALSVQEGICAHPDCNEPAKFFEPDLGDAGYALCGVHHAGYWAWRRIKASGLTELQTLTRAQKREMKVESLADVTIGRHYRGHFHLSLYDPSLGSLASRHDDIGQLIDHLSGQRDSNGDLIPHPLDCRLEAA